MTVIWLLLQAVFWSSLIVALIVVIVVLTLGPWFLAGRYLWQHRRVRPPLT